MAHQANNQNTTDRLFMQQLRTMLELQNSMNTKVHAEWRSQGFDWYRAIWIECGEMLDHYGWKWWKKQTPDVPQVELELIDIWHFGLSVMLQSGMSVDAIVAKVEAELVIETDEADFRVDLESFAERTLNTKGFDIPAFARLMAGIGMSFDKLFEGYVGKNVLNFFRQDHGYKDGSYIKMWAGKEDNEHLVEVLVELDASKPTFGEDLYQALEVRYQSAAQSA